jgi:hypothetical protein
VNFLPPPGIRSKGSVGGGPGSLVVSDLMREIQGVYQRWLDGELSQEDTLFAIGDLLEMGASDGDEGDVPGDRQAVGQKTP